jgi:hypothetical protein
MGTTSLHHLSDLAAHPGLERAWDLLPLAVGVSRTVVGGNESGYALYRLHPLPLPADDNESTVVVSVEAPGFSLSNPRLLRTRLKWTGVTCAPAAGLCTGIPPPPFLVGASWDTE